MTKKHFAKELITIIASDIELGVSEKETVNKIAVLLDTLQPKDLARFSKWGTPEQKTTPENCWL